MTSPDKPADTAYPVHDLIARRWSPRSFTERPVSREVLGSVFEAARWAASSFNDQPWGFVVATSDDTEGHAALGECLVPGNRTWAERAPVLVLSAARTTFAHNGEPNRHAWHDVGLATAQLCLQALALGLGAHPMAGFDRERARAAVGLPGGWEPVAVIALGYPGDPEDLPESLAARERAPRARRPLAEIVHFGTWGRAAPRSAFPR